MGRQSDALPHVKPDVTMANAEGSSQGSAIRRCELQWGNGETVWSPAVVARDIRDTSVEDNALNGSTMSIECE